MNSTYIEQSVRDPEERRLFQQELAIESVTGLICKVMEEKGVTRADLAERLGMTRGWITQLLDGEKNKTVRTLSNVLFELGSSLEFWERPLEDVFEKDVLCTIEFPLELYTGIENSDTYTDVDREVPFTIPDHAVAQ